MYFLDTNVVSAMLKSPSGRIAQRVLDEGAGRIAISIIVASELLFGIAKRPGTRSANLVRGAVDRINVVPFEPPADEAYAAIRATLERAGQVIGPNDLLIAAHALATNRTLVTANAREFARVPGLAVEDWSAA